MRRCTLNGHQHPNAKSLEAYLVSMHRDHEGLQDGVLFCENSKSLKKISSFEAIDNVS